MTAAPLRPHRINVTLRQHYPLPSDPMYREECFTNLWKTNFISVIDVIRYGLDDNKKVVESFPLVGIVNISVFLIPDNSISSRTLAYEVLGLHSLLDGQAIHYEEIQTQPERLSNKAVVFEGSDLLDRVTGFLQKNNTSSPTLQANLVTEKFVTVSKNEFKELTSLHKYKQEGEPVEIFGKDYIPPPPPPNRKQQLKVDRPMLKQPTVERPTMKQPCRLHKFMSALKSTFQLPPRSPPGKKAVVIDKANKEKYALIVIDRSHDCTCSICVAVRCTHRQ